MRTIKFRAWRKEYIKMFTWEQMVNYEWGFADIDIGDDIFMQYTGLSDKNGKEVYFKDVIKSDDKEIGIVEWDDDNGCIILETLDGDIWSDSIGMISLGKIIGNIYDNPELIKDKE